MRNITLLFFCCLLIGVTGCKKKDPDPDPQEDFDRASLLNNLSTNLIIPRYERLRSAQDTFNSRASTFINTPDSINLLALKESFESLYRNWQKCSAFELGKAEQLLLRASVNTFPTDTATISNNINTGVYDLDLVANIDAKGLPAIDYLLYFHDHSTTLALFTSDPKAANRKNYLSDLSSDLSTKFNAVLNDWNSAYKSTFVSNTGTDIGSSTALLVNQLTYDLELIKNAKIGIPLGKKTLGIPVPEKTEALYKGFSVELAAINLKNLEFIFKGNDTSGTDGIGLDDYLDHVNASYSGSALSTQIKNQFTIAYNKLNLIPDPLSNSVSTQTQTVDSAYTELQKLVVLLKTDMTSALGIQITYQDADGD